MDNGSTTYKNVAESSKGVSNLRRSTRRRAADDTQLPDTASKRRKLEVTDDVALNSNVSKSGFTTKQIKSIDDLPPEMLDAILKYVAAEDLLKCREVNRKWNDHSLRILSHRDDMEFRFRFENGHFEQNESKTLRDFMDCFKESTLPCSHFDFGDLQHFENEDIKNFLSFWGKQIFSLTIFLEPDLTIETLRKLLLDQVPNLKKLEIEFDWHNDDDVSSRIQLFDNSNKFELPKLETVVIFDYNRKYRTITENLLTSARNLKRLDLSLFVTVEDLIMLQSVNKLHCVKEISICLSEDLINYWSKSSNNINLKVESLNLSFVQSLENDKKLIPRASSVINQLMQLSKDVMESLTMAPIAWIPDVVFPKLKKLHQLILRPGWTTDTTMFPPQFDMADSFPNLKELVLEDVFTDNYMSFQLFTIMPSIEILHIHGDVSAEIQETLMKMVPNVKTLHLLDYDSWPFEIKKFRVVADNLKKLETFEWGVSALTHHDLLFSLDAAITGFSENFCRKFSKKFRNKEDLSANHLATIQPRRKHSSILDLKELKQFNFTFIFDESTHFEVCNCDNGEYCEGNCGSETDEGGYEPTNKFYKTGITKVSELLAFQLMPNLKIKIERELDDLI